jgi:glycosyltransferase involved in cell wall biosynthesis
VDTPLKNQPLVSVIMPFYRQDEYLIEAVESVKAQSYPHWELIIVDDGSDRLRAQEILQETAEGFTNIVILRHETNRGVSAAKNTAFSASKGELIVPVDSDDVIVPNYLQKMVDALLSSDADGIYCDLKKFGLVELECCSKTDPIRILSGWFPPNPVLIKREVFEAVGGYDLSFDLGEDACFWIAAHNAGKRFEHLHEPLYLYRSHAESGTSRRGRDYPLILTKLARKYPELYSENVIAIIDLLAEHWVKDIDVHRNLLSEFHKLEAEYKHLHREFHNLLEKTESSPRRIGVKAAFRALMREVRSRK